MALEGGQPAAFFRAAVQLDWYETLDLIGDRYDLVLQMDLEEAIGYIKHRAQKRIDDLIFQRWIAGPQYQMSLDEFKTKLTPVKARSDEEILEEVYAVFEKAGIK